MLCSAPLSKVDPTEALAAASSASGTLLFIATLDSEFHYLISPTRTSFIKNELAERSSLSFVEEWRTVQMF